jgi:hypothetical protein
MMGQITDRQVGQITETTRQMSQITDRLIDRWVKLQTDRQMGQITDRQTGQITD